MDIFVDGMLTNNNNKKAHWHQVLHLPLTITFTIGVDVPRDTMSISLVKILFNS